jgi:hypothetical protein
MLEGQTQTGFGQQLSAGDTLVITAVQALCCRQLSLHASEVLDLLAAPPVRRLASPAVRQRRRPLEPDEQPCRVLPNDGRIALVGHPNDHELTVSVTMWSLAPQPEPAKSSSASHRVVERSRSAWWASSTPMAVIWADSEGEGKGSAFKFTLLTECAHDNHQQEANRSRR